MDLPADVERHFHTILSNVDFSRIIRTMESLEWTWAGSSYGVPTIPELYEQAFDLLKSVYEEYTKVGDTYPYNSSILSGGLEASLFVPDAFAKPVYTMKFVLTYADSEWDDR